MNREEIVRFLLRIGVAFAFIYPAIAAYFNPLAWIGFFPGFLRDIFPGNDIFLLHGFGVTEIILALWILIGRNIFIPSILASLYLSAIVIFNISLMDIVFRDLSILAMTLALLAVEKRESPKSAE